MAYAKIKAGKLDKLKESRHTNFSSLVYPQLTKDEIAASSVDKLLKAASVQDVLGTTKKVEESKSENFYRRLQHYVDSKEKATGDANKKEKRVMEFWPLIKVVKIYTKAAALSTGAVIVDLPGVHDSNAARAAVAQNYMKQCTGLWIVAPINRAVDDKAAKALLGESFKRQLKFDGIYSRVTFICSKTDDISVMEASDSLGLEEQMSASWTEIDRIASEKKTLKNKIQELRDTKKDLSAVLDDIEDELEVWEKLKDDLADGKTVYAPRDKTNKRKRDKQSSKQRKKTTKRKDDSEEEEESERSDADLSDAGSDEGGERGEPLNGDAVDDKINELRATKKDTRRERTRLEAEVKSLSEEDKKLQAKEDELDAEMSAVCIAGRNNYSKGAIQQDFAAGIKELDQENAAEEDEANFNPDEDLRDYEEVARSLPVFCVSSRAYQKLSGRLLRDNNVPGFKTIEETEVCIASHITIQ